MCRRDYDAELEKCPNCRAWQGDNKVMAEPAPKPLAPPPKPGPTTPSDARDPEREPSSSPAQDYLAAAFAWTAIGVGLWLLLRDSYVAGGAVLACGGMFNWVMVRQVDTTWIELAASVVWFIAVPAAGVAMWSGGHAISGGIALAMAFAPIVSFALDASGE
jgi:hypothetical protein